MRMDEEWRTIARNNNYEVSNYGRIRRKCNKRIKIAETCKSGYPTIRLSYGIPGKGTHYSIHKLVAEAFLPNPKGLPCVNHIDGDKTNNYVDNLEWCTYSHNNKHAYDNGLKKPSNQIISIEDRKQIEKMYQSGIKIIAIADMFGVTTKAIYKLHSRGKVVW